MLRIEVLYLLDTQASLKWSMVEVLQAWRATYSANRTWEALDCQTRASSMNHTNTTVLSINRRKMGKTLLVPIKKTIFDSFDLISTKVFFWHSNTHAARTESKRALPCGLLDLFMKQPAAKSWILEYHYLQSRTDAKEKEPWQAIAKWSIMFCKRTPQTK